MAIVRFTPTLQTACVSPIITAIDAGSGAGIIEIYNGTIPADPTVAVTTQTKLGTLTFSDPCGVEASGVVTMDPITQDSSADASGTASWARIKDSDGNAKIDVDITSTGGGGALQMNHTSVAAGGPILISSLEFYIG